MDARKLTEALSVGPQITPDEVAAARAQGFRAIVCNRPDGEGDQADFAEIETAAESAGLEARYLPVAPSRVSDADAEAFAALLAELPGPVLAYCRSGTRSATLWALAEAGRRPVPEILGVARNAGYDLGGLAGRLVGRP